MLRLGIKGIWFVSFFNHAAEIEPACRHAIVYRSFYPLGANSGPRGTR
jgi:hypothetical protein